MPLVSPAYTVGGINRKSFSQLNGKLRTKEKNRNERCHIIWHLNVSGPFLKFEDCSQFIALPPTAAFTTAFQLQASFQSILLPLLSRSQIYISIGLGYMEFQNQHVIGAIVFYTSPERATFMLLKPCFVMFSLFLFCVFSKLDWDQYLCWEPYIYTEKRSYRNKLDGWFILLFLRTRLSLCYKIKGDDKKKVIITNHLAFSVSS